MYVSVLLSAAQLKLITKIVKLTLHFKNETIYTFSKLNFIPVQERMWRYIASLHIRCMPGFLMHLFPCMPITLQTEKAFWFNPTSLPNIRYARMHSQGKILKMKGASILWSRILLWLPFTERATFFLHHTCSFAICCIVYVRLCNTSMLVYMLKMQSRYTQSSDRRCWSQKVTLLSKVIRV